MKKFYIVFFLGFIIYHPLVSQWTTINMEEGRWLHSSVAINGKLIIAGGMKQGFTPIRSVEIYDIVTGDWTTADLSDSRGYMATAVNGNKVFFAGGGTFTGVISDKIDVYDAANNTWDTLQLTAAKNGVAAASVGTKVIFAGGGTWNSETIDNLTGLIEIYDIESREWTYRTMSVPRAFMGVAVADGKVYLGGGVTEEQVQSDVLDIYDVENDMLTSTTLSAARGFLSALAVGDKVIFAGGSDVANLEYDEADCYNTETGNWDPINNLPQKKGLMAAAVMCNKGYFAGGSEVDGGSVTDPFKAVHIYDGPENVWLEDMELTTARVGASAAVWDNQLFFSGGFNWESFMLSSIEIYTEPTCTTTSTHSAFQDFNISLSPNPSADVLKVEFSEPGTFQVEISNLQGRRFVRQTGLNGPTFELPVGQLPSGLYFIKIENEELRAVGKFVKTD